MPAVPRLTPVVRLRLINAFLVAEDDGLTLVDTTVPRGASRSSRRRRRSGCRSSASP
jgi:hypothetical protein